MFELLSKKQKGAVKTAKTLNCAQTVGKYYFLLPCSYLLIRQSQEIYG